MVQLGYGIVLYYYTTPSGAKSLVFDAVRVKLGCMIEIKGRNSWKLVGVLATSFQLVRLVGCGLYGLPTHCRLCVERHTSKIGHEIILANVSPSVGKFHSQSSLILHRTIWQKSTQQ